MNSTEKDLWRQVTSYDALHVAWAKVDANEGSAGGDGVKRSEFRSDLYARLNALRADLLSGRYVSRPFRKVAIPKKKPGYRILTIPSIRDRIVHTSIALTLTPVLEPTFENSSFGYRPGRGVKQAVEQIDKWRNRGYSFVVEADIVRFFDNIDHELLLEKLRTSLQGISGSDSLLSLISDLLADQGKALGSDGGTATKLYL